MGNPQKIKFRNVEDFLDYLPDAEREIVEELRELVMTSLPCCTEKMAYNVPFYSQKSRICFIWPASVPWGNIKEGVALGFVKGYKLDPEGDILLREGRKSVGRFIFTDSHMIDRLLVSSFLYEAGLLDK
jgi:hypothetical protein